MSEKLNFTKKEQFSDWLENQPADWARAIAARAALRVLPLAADVLRDSIPAERQINLIFCVLRANFISSGAYGEDAPDDINRFADAAAASSAAYASAAYASSAASSAAYASAAAAAASSASSAASDASYAAAYAAYASSAASSAAAAAMWRSVSADAQWLADGHGDGGDLRRQKLWLTTDGAPAWVTESWRKLKAAPLVVESGFAPWLAWYEALVPLGRRKKPAAYFSPDLARRIALQPNEWWDRGATACNADIAAWVEAEKAGDVLKRLNRAAKKLPPAEPTAYVYHPQNGKVAAEEVKAQPTKPAAAEVYYDELRAKACAMADRLESRRDMLEDWVVDSVLGLRHALPDRLDDLNPHHLRVRLRPVRKIAAEYQLSDNVQGVYREFRAQISELAECGDDLEACLTELRQVEAEKITRSIPPEQEAAAKARFDDIVGAAISAASHVDDSAKIGLQAEKAVADENASPEEKRARLGEYGLAARNFSRAFAKLGKQIVEELGHEFVEGGAKPAMRDMGRFSVVGGFALLANAIAGPVGALACFAAGYNKIDDMLAILKEWAARQKTPDSEE